MNFELSNDTSDVTFNEIAVRGGEVISDVV